MCLSDGRVNAAVINTHPLLFCFVLSPPLTTFVGVCQANDIDGTDASMTTGWHKHNGTMEHHTNKPPTAHGHQPHAVKGELPV